jgi:hypothetical protein
VRQVLAKEEVEGAHAALQHMLLVIDRQDDVDRGHQLSAISRFSHARSIAETNLIAES